MLGNTGRSRDVGAVCTPLKWCELVVGVDVKHDHLGAYKAKTQLNNEKVTNAESGATFQRFGKTGIPINQPELIVGCAEENPWLVARQDVDQESNDTTKSDARIKTKPQVHTKLLKLLDAIAVNKFVSDPDEDRLDPKNLRVGSLACACSVFPSSGLVHKLPSVRIESHKFSVVSEQETCSTSVAGFHLGEHWLNGGNECIPASLEQISTIMLEAIGKKSAYVNSHAGQMVNFNFKTLRNLVPPYPANSTPAKNKVMKSVKIKSSTAFNNTNGFDSKINCLIQGSTKQIKRFQTKILPQ